MSFLVALQYATMHLDFLLIGTYKDLIRECKRIGTVAKITKRTVDALVASDRERVVWDDDLKGFGVRIHHTGRVVLEAIPPEHDERSHPGMI